MGDMRLLGGQLHAVRAQAVEGISRGQARRIPCQPVITGLLGGTYHRGARPQGVVEIETDQADMVEHRHRGYQPGRSLVATGGGLPPLSSLWVR